MRWSRHVDLCRLAHCLHSMIPPLNNKRKRSLMAPRGLLGVASRICISKENQGANLGTPLVAADRHVLQKHNGNSLDAMHR